MKEIQSKKFFRKKQISISISKRLIGQGLLFFLFLSLFLPQISFSNEMSDLQRCMLETMNTADDIMTIGEVRQKCLKKLQGAAEGKAGEVTVATEKREGGVVDRRLDADKRHTLEPYTLMSHKPNYFIIASHNASGINEELFREQFDDPNIKLDDTEAKFQISIKMPLAVGLFKNRFDIFGAYTNRSFWQVYNKDVSAPFRETNHEPEAWFQIRNDWSFLGFKNSVNGFGFVHQSNGRGGILSRSWNRLYANFILERQNLAISFKPWLRISEDEDDDDNSDITDYMGHYELRSAYKCGENTFSLMLRNNLESGFEKGAVELGWSFPIWHYKYLKGYVQYFNGYGESLIDYNRHSNSIGIGVAITDWL